MKYHQKHNRGTYVHPKKRTRNDFYTAKGKTRAKQRRNGKKRERKGKENKERREKDENKIIMHAQGAGRVPRGQGYCLLVRSVLRYVDVMDQHEDDTTRSDGRQENKGKKRIIEEGKDTAQKKAKKNKKKHYTSIILCLADGARTAQERPRGKQRRRSQKTKTNSNVG